MNFKCDWFEQVLGDGCERETSLVLLGYLKAYVFVCGLASFLPSCLPFWLSASPPSLFPYLSIPLSLLPLPNTKEHKDMLFLSHETY